MQPMASEYRSGQMRLSPPCSDRLSNLPGELINHILKFLPIRDVVRTSVLSWDWRFKWMTIPVLVFNPSSIPPSGASEGQRNRKLVDLVNQVMLLHNGILDRFEMRICLENSCNDVDRWILLLARKLVNEFVFSFSGGNHYNMPSSLFSCQSLRRLQLHACILKSPSRTKGFNSLVDLTLRQVTITNDTIASLISNSRQLQKLTLFYCNGFHRLYICAPNLSIFYIKGCCGDIHFENSPKLKSAYLGLLPVATGVLPNHLGTSMHRLEVVLASLRRVEKLFISEHFMEMLAACVAPKKLRTTYHHLKDLSLVINLANSNEFSTAMCLFRSSPCLQNLTICGSSTGQSTLLTEDECQSAILNEEEIIYPELKTMTLSEFRGIKNELGFVKFILVNAVKLHTMNITWDASVPVGPSRTHILQRMMQFQRASPTAVVNFLG